MRKMSFLLFGTLGIISITACAEFNNDKIENVEEKSAFSKCEYNEENEVMISVRLKPLGFYQIDDYIALYKGKVIGIESPSNGMKFPEGLSKGKYIESFGEESFYELCGDNLDVYPHLELAEVNTPDAEDIDENETTDSEELL